MMQYKGYSGRVEYDDVAEIFHGEVIGLRDVITFPNPPLPLPQKMPPLRSQNLIRTTVERAAGIAATLACRVIKPVKIFV